MDGWAAGILALAGVAIGALGPTVKDFFLERRQADRDRRQRRWTLEFESLQQLSDLVMQFADISAMRSPTLEALKVRAAYLAFLIRDDRVRLVVEPLLAAAPGSQEWRDQVGNAARRIGEVIRTLEVD